MLVCSLSLDVVCSLGASVECIYLPYGMLILLWLMLQVKKMKLKNHYEMREYNIDILEDEEEKHAHLECRPYPLYPSKAGLKPDFFRDIIVRLEHIFAVFLEICSFPFLFIFLLIFNICFYLFIHFLLIFNICFYYFWFFLSPQLNNFWRKIWLSNVVNT